MELDQLKSDWKTVETPIKTEEELRLMLVENKHPVLKSIRKQLTIEIAVWSVFLFCYYTMFDGHQKPVLINLLLVVSVLFSLIHNISGYGFAKYLINGNTIKTSLEHYLSKIKIYAIVSVLSRILLMGGFLTFFTYNISFTSIKYILLIGLILLFSGQLVWLSFMWAKRLKSLGSIVRDFS